MFLTVLPLFLKAKLVDILSPQASDADYGLAMSGIKPSEHTEKGEQKNDEK